MGEVLNLRAYQQEASAAANQEPSLGWTTKANELLAAGWEHKVRQGLRIWTDPSKPFRGWYSEQVAHGKLKGEIP